MLVRRHDELVKVFMDADAARAFFRNKHSRPPQ